ncbi:hypothetical protein FEM48_Zijuj09G0155600 [Ziziphus jujuba var. spinosa]|uniref:Uncharacterized protein n=1 Tax=Ziziphus jujuba var. spinosa TaxID=714518 RepID=A0A978UTT8_ZIZJJ|nr:hypothetical protein FEM48_Zijuj09G0155600 [Ziziphus jujuba var. spinosa]
MEDINSSGLVRIPKLNLVADEPSVRLISQCSLVGKVISNKIISRNKVQMITRDGEDGDETRAQGSKNESDRPERSELTHHQVRVDVEDKLAQYDNPSKVRHMVENGYVIEGHQPLLNTDLFSKAFEFQNPTFFSKRYRFRSRVKGKEKLQGRPKDYKMILDYKRKAYRIGPKVSKTEKGVYIKGNMEHPIGEVHRDELESLDVINKSPSSLAVASPSETEGTCKEKKL